MPWPFLKLALAFCRSKLPSPSRRVSAFFCQTHIIWAAFSSSVIRDNRSWTRFSMGRTRFLYGCSLPFLDLLKGECPLPHLVKPLAAEPRPALRVIFDWLDIGFSKI